jgi:DNA (cytosine-5)-methyltransferase 1
LPGLVHPYEIRKLTIAEVKALTSCPEGFEFVGNYRAKWARIGNSVPPLFVKALAASVRRNLFTANDSSDRFVAAKPW